MGHGVVEEIFRNVFCHVNTKSVFTIKSAKDRERSEIPKGGSGIGEKAHAATGPLHVGTGSPPICVNSALLRIEE